MGSSRHRDRSYGRVKRHTISRAHAFKHKQQAAARLSLYC